VIVRVLLPNRSAYGNAIVNLKSFNGQIMGTQSSTGQVQIKFPDLPVGKYTVEVIAPGFETAEETAELWVRRQTDDLRRAAMLHADSVCYARSFSLHSHSIVPGGFDVTS